MVKTTVLKINSINPVRSRKSRISVISSGVNKKSLFQILLGVLILFLGLYLCFITQTIMNTASYEKIEKSIAVLDSNLGELEAESLALKREINFDLVKKLGYVEVANVKFVDKNIIKQTLSLVKTVN